MSFPREKRKIKKCVENCLNVSFAKLRRKRTFSTALTKSSLQFPHLAFLDAKKRKQALDSFTSLSTEQRAAIELAKSGSSMFITGPGGTGKSFLLKCLVRELEALHGSGVHVTASTGIAAFNIEGVTVHSFTGINAEGKSSILNVNPAMKKRWKEAKVLVIDEVSMLSADMFEQIDSTAREIRGNNKPFGGLQLILCGDFFQLPPVPSLFGPPRRFCFESPLWLDSIEHSIELQQPFRQRDPEFYSILNDIRWGKISKSQTNTLKQQCVNRKDISIITPTLLYPCKAEVANENLKYLEGLPGDSYEFKAHDVGDTPQLRALRKNSQIPEILQLKKETQVILLKNLDVAKGLVNGARGIVVGFSEDKKSGGIVPVVKFTNGVEKKIKPTTFTATVNGKKLTVRKQVPLNYGWAMSIHKAQGMTLDRVAVDLSFAFEFGQAYVALSRARSMAGLFLRSFNEHVIKAHPKVIEFYQKFARSILPGQNVKTQEVDGRLLFSNEKKRVKQAEIVRVIPANSNLKFSVPLLPPPVPVSEEISSKSPIKPGKVVLQQKVKKSPSPNSQVISIPNIPSATFSLLDETQPSFSAKKPTVNLWDTSIDPLQLLSKKSSSPKEEKPKLNKDKNTSNPFWFVGKK